MSGPGLPLVIALALGPPGADGGDVPEAGQRSVGTAIAVEAGETCLDPERLRAQVIEFRGDPTVDARLEVRVVGSRPDHVRFEVVWEGKAIVVRDFEPAPEECDDLHAVVGVALAIAIDDESLAEAIARADEPAPEPERPPEPEPEPEPELVLEPAPASEPEAASAGGVTTRVGTRDRAPTRVALGLDGVLLVGVIPQLAGGAAVGLEVGPLDWLDVRVAGLASFAIDREFAGGLLDFGLGGASLDLCGGGPSRWRVRPRGCVGLLASAIRWVGRGYDVSEAGTAPWVSVNVGGDLRIALAPRFGLQLSTRVGIPLLKSDYALKTQDGQRTLAAPPVGGFVGFGPIFGVL
jgi:hypothetical protein